MTKQQELAQARSIKFSARAPVAKFGLQEELLKVGFLTIGDLYQAVLDISSGKGQMINLVKRFDKIDDPEMLRGVLARILYAAGICASPMSPNDIDLLANKLTARLRQNLINASPTEIRSGQETELAISEIIAKSVLLSNPKSAADMNIQFQEASGYFQNELDTTKQFSNRHLVSAMVLDYLLMTIQDSGSIELLTNSLAGNRRVLVTLKDLGKIDVEYLVKSNPRSLAQIFVRDSKSAKEEFTHKIKKWWAENK
jgi:hypothetical protein